MKAQKKHKNIIYHEYFKRSGLYKFLLENIFKIIIILAVFVVAYYLIDTYVIKIDTIFEYIFNKISPIFIIILFFISETILGLIPPDIFIIWSQQFTHPYIIVTILAIVSYLGGALSFKIGERLRLFPSVNNYLIKKYDKHVLLIKKWGGIIIVFSALFPLPYSSICMIAGMLKYPFTRLLLLGITRLLRFFLYAVILFGLI